MHWPESYIPDYILPRNIVSSLSNGIREDHEKGQHVKHQLHLWSQALGIRVRIQKALAIGNRLPQVNPSSFGRFCEIYVLSMIAPYLPEIH